MNNWLISPTVQIVDINGNPVVGGKVFVYDADTNNLSTIYSDETTVIANPVEIDELGNVTIWAELSKFYDIAVYDTSDNLLFAKKHICPGILSETNLDINAGDGCIVTKSGDTYTISVDFDTVATQAELVNKQDKLEAGRNIEITPANVINVTGRRAIVTQSPLQSNMSDSAWVVSFDSDTFIGSNGIMETSKLEYDPTSSRYVSYNDIPLGEAGGTFTGVSANIPFTGNGTNESPLGLLPYISYGGNGITSTYSKSGLRVIDSNNNSAYYSASGINLNNEFVTDTNISSWNDVYNTVSTASGSWQGGSNLSGLFEAIYGQTTYNDIRDAVNDKKIVYCRISPTGASRMAFLAYGGSYNYEFQYYRSLIGHTTADQGDEVYVYTVDSDGWTSAMRKTYTQVVPGTNVQSSYNISQGKLTLGVSGALPIINGGYTADCDGSAFKISTRTSTLTLSENGAKYASYPSTNIEAPWTSIIAKAKEPQYIPTVSSYTFIVNNEVDVQYSAVDMLNEITFIAAGWGNFLNYSANFKDGDTNKGTLVIPSGKVMTATKNWNWEDNGFRWNKKLQDGTLMPM